MGSKGLTISISKVVSSEIQDGERIVKNENYTNYSREARTFSPAGMDVAPLDGDQVLILEAGPSSQTAQIGIVNKDVIAEKGEMRIYSRDSDGNVKASVHCKANGDIEIVSSGKIAIDNQAEKLKVLFDDLMEEIKDIVTIGSPSVHTIKPTTKAKLDALKARFNNLFKEA